MLKNSTVFSSFSVDDLAMARKFYSQTLGLEVTKEEMGNLALNIKDGTEIIIYPKGKGHAPASFTVLNFMVDDIDSAVEQLSAHGVKFEQYDGDIKTNQKGIHQNGNHYIAWFKDPAGNILSIIESNKSRAAKRDHG